MNYYLAGHETNKKLLIKALNQYARDRSIEQLAQTLKGILQTPAERKLLREIRNITLVLLADLALGHLEQVINTGRWQDGRRKRKTAGTVRVRREGPGAGFGFTLSGDSPVFIKTVDRGGAADQAGIKSGDHILEINGLNVRGKPHLHVVQLLRGSGSQPTLLIQWRPTSALKHQSLSSLPTSSKSSQHSVTFENERPATVSRCSSMASKAFSFRSDLLMNGVGYHGAGYQRSDLRSLARQFKIQMSELLTRGRANLLSNKALTSTVKTVDVVNLNQTCLVHNVAVCQFKCINLEMKIKSGKNVQRLIRALEPVLDDGAKLQMLHYLSELLPEAEQQAFDRAAARMISRKMDTGVVPSLDTNNDEVADVLYRVQAMRLSDAPRPRNTTPGAVLSDEPYGNWPSSGAVRGRLSPGFGYGSDLDTVPVRDTRSRNGTPDSGWDDYDDDLDLGLEELADALLADEIRKSSVTTIQTQAQIHSPITASSPEPGTQESRGTGMLPQPRVQCQVIAVSEMAPGRRLELTWKKFSISLR
ncbi:Delphilin [Desmophyllum pertusum]|uniref:Delphilin n=1 Tax=Desmophyllum pertusum TaxID=174260 RepID=A0A9W9ZI37_9CNID|nr:Delphilin [Desmophyllum pertusum]